MAGGFVEFSCAVLLWASYVQPPEMCLLAAPGLENKTRGIVLTDENDGGKTDLECVTSIAKYGGGEGCRQNRSGKRA